ncbi:MAG TPA: mechanosensitive ion channel family protein [Candidatus Limnocylindrales bacterium]|nr:mechanosensitive ion channel family protein [Candidatus Limnocylindrales bacterium]
MKLPADLQDQLLAIVGDVVLPVLLIVVLALVVFWLSRAAVHTIVKTLLDRETTEGTAQELSAVEVKKRMTTLEGLGTTVIRLFVLVIATVMILGELNLNIGPAVAGLGVVGIAVGFGTQSIVRDYFTGALILIENQFSKGDVVTIAGVSGTVEDFSLRRTTLRDLDGVVHTVPNGEIKVASNRTRVWARINLDVTIAYGTDVERATLVVDDVGRAMVADPEWRRRLMEAPHVERIEAMGEYGITIKILGLVRATEQWAAGGELRKRLLAAFATHGIEIPRPQRVVLARDPALDPFAAGGATLEGPTQDDLSAGTE